MISNRASLHYVAGVLAGFLACAAIFLLAAEFAMGVPLGRNIWAWQLWERKTALASHTPGNRIFVVGGSSTLFGIKARRIEQAFGRQTINFGTYYVLHSDYMISRMKAIVRPGDTVVLAFEYPLYFHSNAMNVGLIDYLMEYDPDYLRGLPPAQRMKFLWNIPFRRVYEGDMARLMGRLPARSAGLFDYDANTLDDHGDETLNEPGHISEQKVKELRARLAAQGPDTEILNHKPDGSELQKITDFHAWGKAHDVTVAVTWPNDIYFAQYDDPQNRALFDGIQNALAKAGVPVLGGWRDGMLDRRFFFDSPHHLTDEGRKIRTARLVDALCRLLQPAGQRNGETNPDKAGSAPSRSDRMGSRTPQSMPALSHRMPVSCGAE